MLSLGGFEQCSRWVPLKTCNCLCNALYAGAFSDERKFEIIGHLQKMHMVHDTRGFYTWLWLDGIPQKEVIEED